MKKMLTVTGMIASIVIIISCSKDDKPSVAAGTFTMDGYTFVESSAKDTTSSDNLNVLSGEGSTSDKKKAIFAFIFTAKPTSSGEYRIYTDTLDSSLPASDQVAIFAEDSLSIAHEGLFTSGTGISTTLTAKVSVDASGKLTITIPSISLVGDVYDNSDANNTVFKKANITISGSFVQK